MAIASLEANCMIFSDKYTEKIRIVHRRSGRELEIMDLLF